MSVKDSAGAPYRHLQIHRIIAEVDLDWEHGHRSERDAAGKQEEEDQTADEDAQRHGDKHVQLPEIKNNPEQLVVSHSHMCISMDLSRMCFLQSILT